MKGLKDHKDSNLYAPLLQEDTEKEDAGVQAPVSSEQADRKHGRSEWNSRGAHEPKNNEDINVIGSPDCKGHESGSRPGRFNVYVLAGAVLASTTSVLLGYGERPAQTDLQQVVFILVARTVYPLVMSFCV